MNEIFDEVKCEELYDTYHEEELAWLQEAEELNKELLELC